MITDLVFSSNVLLPVRGIAARLRTVRVAVVGVRFPSVCVVDDCDNTCGVAVEFSEVTKGNVSGIPRELRVYKEFSPIFSRLPALPIINSTFCLSYPTDFSSSSSPPCSGYLILTRGNVK